MNSPDTESTLLREPGAARRLLVAFAHPDDESFGPAGTILHYTQQGVDVHYVCATRGEAGVADPELLHGYDSLAALRTEELLCAARILGLTGLHLLNYHDSGMENAPENENPACLFQAPLEQVAERIARLIRQIQPQVVLTFDATGGYFHPDHVKMHQATTLAFHAAGDPARFPDHLDTGLTPFRPQKLYYTTFPHHWVKWAVRILPLFGQDPTAMGHNKDINIQRIADIEQQVTTRVRVSPYYETCLQAARCYASQNGSGRPGILGFLDKWLFRYDTFVRAAPPFDGGTIERDLFEGIDEA